MAERPVIIIVDIDDKSTLEVIRNVLINWEIKKIELCDLLNGYLRVEYETPAFIMLNAQPDKSKTVELCRKIKGDPTTTDIPLLVVLDMNKVTQIQYVLEVGADKCIVTPLKESYFKKSVKELISDR